MMRIKPQYGYWDTTHYPIGGSFHRAGQHGLAIVAVLRSFDTFKGCNREGQTDDGRTVAYDVAHIELTHPSAREAVTAADGSTELVSREELEAASDTLDALAGRR